MFRNITLKLITAHGLKEAIIQFTIEKYTNELKALLVATLQLSSTGEKKRYFDS